MLPRILSTSDLAALGLTRRKIAGLVAAGELRRLRIGWFAEPGVPEPLAQAVAAGGLLTCVSALAHHGAWCPPHGETHVRIPDGARIARSAGLRRHSARERLELRAGADAPLTALAEAARCLDYRELVVVTDSCLNRGLVGLADTELALSRTARGRRALPLIDPRAESGLESIARVALRAHGVRVRPQVSIPGVGRVDLLIGDRLILELDGLAWHGDFERDRSRDRAASVRGYLVLRAGYRQVMERWSEIEEQVLALVRRREHRWTARTRGAACVDLAVTDLTH